MFAVDSTLCLESDMHLRSQSNIMECGGKRGTSATPLCDGTGGGRTPHSPSKAPSPLCSAGALHRGLATGAGLPRWRGCVGRALLFMLLTRILPLAAGQPAGVPVEAWLLGSEPVEEVAPLRGRVVLNGVWRFQPARASAKDAPQTNQWGWLRVPGVWDRVVYPVPFFEGPTPGAGDVWAGLELSRPNTSFDGAVLRTFERGWYERPLEVPSAWAGRRITLKFERVATDARVFLDGREAGEVHWPGNEVDITALARPGSEHTLRVLVVAVADAGEVTTFMDADRPQKQKAELAARGIIGDVLLEASPSAARIAGLFIQPSVRQHQLAVSVEREGSWPSGRHTFDVVAREWPSGREAKHWSVTAEVSPGDQPVTLTLPWADPKLWDFLQPNLYTLEVTARDGKSAAMDSVVERFGFREFRLAGRQMLLNEQPFNWRLMGFEEQIGVPELIKVALRDHAAANFNVAYVWPEEVTLRGKPDHRPDIARAADEVGVPAVMGLPGADPFFDPLTPNPPPAKHAAWWNCVQREWRSLRNSPSVIVFLFQGNRFSHGDDQNPLRLGRPDRLALNPTWAASRAPAQRWLDELAALDPTRPVTSHHSALGQIHTSNNYLNLHPLQERQDWLSAWARDGQAPFSAVEFDPPFPGSLNRGRAGHMGESTSEPLLTEWLAVYRGPAAYAEESPAYRQAIPRWHKSGMDYVGVKLPDFAPFTDFTAWWVTETWLPWRTWGLSGSMWAWQRANGFDLAIDPNATLSPTPWQPGQRGVWLPRVPARLARPMGAGVFSTNAAGHALIAANAPTLGWIAGWPEADPATQAGGPYPSFTDQAHHFVAGEEMMKQVALLNDTRVRQPFAGEVIFKQGDRELGRQSIAGELPVGVPAFVPVSFTLPEVKARTDATLELQVTIGEASHHDRFSFRIYPAPEPVTATKSVLLTYDPHGDTTAWLKSAGAKVLAWDTATTPDAGKFPALVIGRHAFTGRAPDELNFLTARIMAYAEAGGVVLLQGQDPQWLRDNTALRFHHHVSRRLWPVPTEAAHPLVAGLDGEDCRDWRGSGTLRPPEENTGLVKPSSRFPNFGWHWGNRGSVASLMLEKPHRSGWTPLLEGEFDLAWTPLAELRVGQGMILFNGLDLEGRTEREPVAALMARRLVAYLDGAALKRLAALPAGGAAVYLGGDADARRLEALGLKFERAQTPPTESALVVVGRGATFHEAELRDCLAEGGRALFLPGSEAALQFGWTTATNAYRGATSNLPTWPELAGISLSDLRPRTDLVCPLLVAGEGRETAANGAIGRVRVGRGEALFLQLDPDALDADTKTYLRFTRWRFTRTLSQLLANLGGRFMPDAGVLTFAAPGGLPMTLGGEWRYQVEHLLGPVASPQQAPADPGVKDPAVSAPGFDDHAWKTVMLPAMMENADGALRDRAWAIWFRRGFDAPAAWTHQPVALQLGVLDDFDEVYLNGVKIGATGRETAEWWAKSRTYPVPAGLLRAADNVLAIRLFNRFGGGGFGAGTPDALKLALTSPPRRATPYHPDYREDHAQGDDPARYYRW